MPDGNMRGASEALSAKFIEEVNLPDRSAVLPGQTLIKSWLLENNGTEAWPPGTNLVFTQGMRELCATDGVAVSSALPGQRVEVSAVLETPQHAGLVMAMFSLADVDGRVFGPRLWANLHVVSDDQPSEEGRKMEGANIDIAARGGIDIALGRLRELGFENEELNQALLDEHDGDVDAVITWLRDNGM
jgi:next-to-BRCA1 protein 1